ncbi:hypothetical protein [Myxococcus sp. AB036A]|uniref:hypothetical protein n=1 Tax=Myxococcus sp. AB036A TaxID=2562793 RepID=UPI0011469B1C|nr:hypothetical protein [Myxococcus sp. AB036A]
MHPINTHVGHLYNAANQALAPASQVEGIREGAAIDVSKYQSGTLVANVGSISGGPTATVITYSLQSSATGTDGWTALRDLDDTEAELTITSANTCSELDFALQHVPQDHRFLRVVEMVEFTDGTTPAVVAGATLVLGGGQRLPL